MKSQIHGEMILSCSDNRARGPVRPPRVGAKLKASIDTSCLTTESHETHHDLFSFTKTGEHFVLSDLDWTFITHVKKKEKKKEQNKK